MTTPTLDPKLQTRVTEAMKHFQQAYQTGHKLLLDELKKSHPTDTLKTYQANLDSLEMLDSPESLNTFLNNGKPIHELLGFSPDVINTFYNMAYNILNQKRYKDAKDAFFFLVTIAPQVTECWLGLGYSYGHCDENEGAIQSYLRAIALSPHRADGYLAFARLCTALKDFPRAQKVCDIGLNFVKAHKQQPWAAELGKMLENAKSEINQLSKQK